MIATGRNFVDAPVSGGVVGATGGTLTIMAAAPKQVFEAAKPMLRVLGDKLFHVGEEPGQGAMVKTVNQLLCGVHIAVAAEAFSLGARAGLDPAVLLDILSGSAASSWMLRDRGPRMLQATPAVASAVDIFVRISGLCSMPAAPRRRPCPSLPPPIRCFSLPQGWGMVAATTVRCCVRMRRLTTDYLGKTERRRTCSSANTSASGECDPDEASSLAKSVTAKNRLT